MPVAVPEHPVPSGPLAVRFVSYDLGPLRAGTWSSVRVELENAGSGTWHTTGPAQVRLSYHVLDRFGNVLLWEGLRAVPPRAVAPGECVELEVPFGVPMPPARYRLVLDLVDEGRLWFAELGNRPLELDLDVRPRIAQRTMSVRIAAGPPELVAATQTALDAQQEAVVDEGEAIAFLAPGCRPTPEWSRLLLDYHAAGFAAVAGSIDVTGSRLRRRLVSELAPWKPGFGAAPSWPHPLLCPSLLADVVPAARWAEPVMGLPALDQGVLADAWLCDGRIRVAVDVTDLRPDGRRHDGG